MCQLDSLGSRHWDRHGGAKVCKRAGHVKKKSQLTTLFSYSQWAALRETWPWLEIWVRSERHQQREAVQWPHCHSWIAILHLKRCDVSFSAYLSLSRFAICTLRVNLSGERFSVALVCLPSRGNVQEWLSLMKQTLSLYLILELPWVFIISLLHNSL